MYILLLFATRRSVLLKSSLATISLSIFIDTNEKNIKMLSSFAFLSCLSLASATSIIRGTQQVATFDDLTAIPAISEINPVGSYKGLKYNSLDILQTGVLGISGTPAQSGDQVAAASITNYLNTGGVSIAADTVKYFDLQSLYVLCAVNSVTSAVGVPEECSVAFTAYKKGSDVAYDTFNFQFNPDTALSSQMHKVNFPVSWFGLEKVDIAVVSSATTESLTALLIDTVSYKSYT